KRRSAFRARRERDHCRSPTTAGGWPRRSASPASTRRSPCSPWTSACPDACSSAPKRKRRGGTWRRAARWGSIGFSKTSSFPRRRARVAPIEPLPSGAHPNAETVEIEIDDGCRVERQDLAEQQAADDRYTKRLA